MPLGALLSAPGMSMKVSQSGRGNQKLYYTTRQAESLGGFCCTAVADLHMVLCLKAFTVCSGALQKQSGFLLDFGSGMCSCGTPFESSLLFRTPPDRNTCGDASLFVVL